MGDFVKADLTRPGAIYEQLAGDRCAGCGRTIADEDRCYADYVDIWHSRCWPGRDFSVYRRSPYQR